MLKIRLQRVGKKHDPVFRVVLTESQNGPKSGKFQEILGSYDARDKNTTQFNGERINHWISKGAQVSDTVRNLLIDQKIIEGKKVNVLPKKSPIVKESEEKDSVPAAEGDAPAPDATAEEPVVEPASEAPAEDAPEPTTETPAEPEAPAEEPKEEAPVPEETPAPEEKPVETPEEKPAE